MILRRFYVFIILLVNFVGGQEAGDTLKKSLALVGHLDNGLSYYIQENKHPEAKAYFQLVVKAGSVQENDGEEGLAHFTQQMAYCKTENFHSGEIGYYLESINSNFVARTYFDKVIYHIEMDSKDVENGVYILSDIAYKAEIFVGNIEREREKLLKKWYDYRGSRQRFQDELLEVLLESSCYYNRFPYGLEDVIRSCTVDDIQRFYKKWFKPELMAFIAVGDFKGTEIKELIEEYFSSIPSSEYVESESISQIPAYNNTRYVIYSDREATVSRLAFNFKRDYVPCTKLDDVYEIIKNNLVQMLIDNRLFKMTKAEFSPFLNANAISWRYTKVMEVLEVEAQCLEESVLEGTKLLFQEFKRIKKYGFTRGEYEKVKKDLLLQLDIEYRESKSFNSQKLLELLSDAFIDGVDALDPISLIKLKKQILSKVLLSDINEQANMLLDVNNCLISVFTPKKDFLKLLTKKDFENIKKEVEDSNIDRWPDPNSIFPYVVESGRIEKKHHFNESNVTQYVLQNGMNVFVKSTNCSSGIVIKGIASGGVSTLYSEKMFFGKFTSDVANESGIGGFDNVELEQLLSGKEVFLDMIIRAYNREINGYCNVEDLEVLMQLIHLNFNEHQISHNAFERILKKSYTDIEKEQPIMEFIDTVTKVNTSGCWFFDPMTWQDLDNISFGKVNDFYELCFSNPSDFSFFFVGPIDLKIETFLSNYLANIPKSNIGLSKYKRLNVSKVKSIVCESVERGMTLDSRAQISFPVYSKASSQQIYDIAILCEFIDLKLHDIQEKLGETFTLSVNYNMPLFPTSDFSFIAIELCCLPNDIENFVEKVLNTLRLLKECKINSKDVNEIKKRHKCYYEKSICDNTFWAWKLSESYQLGENFSFIKHFDNSIDKLSGNKIKNSLNKFIHLDSYTLVYFYPEKPSDKI